MTRPTLSRCWYEEDENFVPRPVPFDRVTEAFEKDRTVLKTLVADEEVSTVFLGIDHNFSGVGPPILYETMIFGGAREDEYQRRYCTRAEAVEGHNIVVKRLRAGLDP